jgi:hypothetical protein
MTLNIGYLYVLFGVGVTEVRIHRLNFFKVVNSFSEMRLVKVRVEVVCEMGLVIYSVGVTLEVSSNVLKIP